MGQHGTRLLLSAAYRLGFCTVDSDDLACPSVTPELRERLDDETSLSSAA